MDESLHVQVRQLSNEEPLGEVSDVPAGGVGQRWSVTVPYDDATDPAQVIVVAIGGHLTDVERFAITGAHSSLAGLHAP